MDPLPTDLQALAAALQRHRVLGQLDTAAREALLARLQPRHFTAQQTVADADALASGLGIVASGSLGFRNPAGGALLRLDAPDWFGAGVQPAAALAGCSAVAEAATLVGFLPADELDMLVEAHPALQLFIELPQAQGATAEPADAQLNLMTTPVRRLLKRAPVTVSPNSPIRAVAELMREQRVSSVLVVENDHLFGLVTDRDLRNRALAAGLDPTLPVVEITTMAPRTIAIDAPGFEALLLMARHNIHHVPVMDGAAVAGMITATDVTEQHSSSAVYLVGDIHKRTTLEGLVDTSSRVRLLQKHLAAAGASAYATGHIVTAITDALTVRLLHLGEAKFGPPPVDYAWVAAGSQARNEQTAKSDQDNCMILDDAYDEAAHGAYFKQLANWVCDGLAACGYVHCPGEMMAMTDKWRQPRRVWAEYFRRWVDTPGADGADADLRLLRRARGGRPLRPARRPARRHAQAHARQRPVPGAHGRQCDDPAAAAGPVRRPEHDPLGRAQGHAGPQAQRHRAGGGPGAHLRAGRRPRRRQHPRPAGARRRQRRDQRTGRARPARRAGIPVDDPHPPSGTPTGRRAGGRQLPAAGRAVQLRARPAQACLRRRQGLCRTCWRSVTRPGVSDQRRRT